jgi:hypothetical protein
MADFSSTEKVNANWKHLFGLLGTYNGSAPNGKAWYEETIAANHIISAEDIWASAVPDATTLIQAKDNAGSVVEDRTDGATVSISPDAGGWLLSISTFEPQVGYQITDQHPNPSYVRSIIQVDNIGSNQYRIFLNDNSGVSPGNVVLQRRIFLTADPSTNNIAWLARSVFGNSFSELQTNFILPQKFGRGYSIRVFQGNGTEVLTTHGAWIFNYQKGLLLFGQGFTPQNLGYSTPIYVELFKYVGILGVEGTIPAGNLNDILHFNGTEYVPTSSVQCDGTDLFVQNRLMVSGSLVTTSGTTPVGFSDTGDEGEVRWDDNFLYIRTSTGWTRTSLHRF